MPAESSPTVGPAKLAPHAGPVIPASPIVVLINGKRWELAVPSRMALCDVLHDIAGCRSVHIGCREGRCGACTVLVDGVPVLSCLMLGVQAANASVVTVEGLRDDPATERRRMGLSHSGGLQCGYCTPGILVHATRAETAADAIAGHLCRCTGYDGIRTGLHAAAGPDPLPDRPHRVEDERLTTGQAQFVADIALPGALHLRVVRAGVAHARISVDAAPARAVPGVLAVLTAADVGIDDLWVPATFRNAPANRRPEPVLAADLVRYVGQPVAAVVGVDRFAAEDGAAAVRVNTWPLAPDPGEVHVSGRQQVGDVDAAFARADVVVTGEFTVQRHTGMPLEPRGLAADWDAARELLTVYGWAKHPDANRRHLAALLGLRPEQVVTAPTDVGGGFGVRGELYPEDVLVAVAAMRLRRPVRWLETRAEHLMATNHAREQRWRVRLAARATGELLGAEVEVTTDIGAYPRPLSELGGLLAAAMFPGPYLLPALRATIRSQQSHKTPVGTYRAPGRFECGWVRERMVRLLADRLGVDSARLRRSWLIGPAELPYDVGTVNEGPVIYHGIDLPAAYDKVAAILAEDQTQPSTPQGRIGRSVVPFVDKAGLGPAESARLTVDSAGVRVAVRTGPAGQGHETTLARVCAAVLAVDPRSVRVVTNDSLLLDTGVGAFASRTAMMAGNAVRQAAEEVAAVLRTRAARRLGVDPQACTLSAGTVTSVDGRRVAIADLVAHEPIDVRATFHSDVHTYPAGALGCVVDVDPQLFTVRVRRLVVACDAGTVLDPVVVHGQLAGAVVAGLGGALWEELGYRDDGVPLTTTLGEYGLPVAQDVPPIEVILLDHGPDPATPLGVKGIGECGIVAVGGAVCDAVVDAVPELAAIAELPLSPSRLLAAWSRNEAWSGK